MMEIRLEVPAGDGVRFTKGAVSHLNGYDRLAASIDGLVVDARIQSASIIRGGSTVELIVNIPDVEARWAG